MAGSFAGHAAVARMGRRDRRRDRVRRGAANPFGTPGHARDRAARGGAARTGVLGFVLGFTQRDDAADRPATDEPAVDRRSGQGRATTDPTVARRRGAAEALDA